MQQNRKGFTLIELLIVVVIIGILAAIAIPKFANTKEKAYLAAMKSDLRNLATAQEAFASDNAGLYTNVAASNLNNAPVPDPATQFVPSAGVTMTATAIAAAGANPAGWNATATHSATNKQCYIYVAGGQVGFGTATSEGEPKCDP